MSPRLAAPQVSPDGGRVAFALTAIDLTGGKRNTDLRLVPVAGGEPRRITSSTASDSRPRTGADAFARVDGRRLQARELRPLVRRGRRLARPLDDEVRSRA
jgi:dipeptidyl aminopeptidase/acylaminoacyl peptidase